MKYMPNLNANPLRHVVTRVRAQTTLRFAPYCGVNRNAIAGPRVDAAAFRP